MTYQKQVDKKHYSFSSYFYKGRWMSYWYQVKEIAEREDIKTILDIGPGTSFLANVLAIHRPDTTYATLDIAEDVKPDIVGGVTAIPLENESYDCVSAFQVLEHIEFSDFETALKEISRVSKKYVMISLPHYGTPVSFSFRLPFFKKINFSTMLPRRKKHVFCGQHYWEIGKHGYSPKKIRKIINNHFNIVTEYSPEENMYHRFYILRKKYE